MPQFDGHSVAIRVVDTGIGIPREMLPRVFDLFTQVDRSIERSSGGLGIGLTLVQRLVELHGGTVEARSEGPDKGSEFVVRLPASLESSGDSAASNSSDAKSAGRVRVLVVDDNVDAADTLTEMLRVSGHDVDTAYDGVAAIDAVGLASARRRIDGHRPAQVERPRRCPQDQRERSATAHRACGCHRLGPGRRPAAVATSGFRPPSGQASGSGMARPDFRVSRTQNARRRRRQ